MDIFLKKNNFKSNKKIYVCKNNKKLTKTCFKSQCILRSYFLNIIKKLCFLKERKISLKNIKKIYVCINNKKKTN